MAKIYDNPDTGNTELWINGDFVAGWTRFEVSDDARGKLERMLDEAFEVGRRAKLKEIQNLLGIK